MFQRVLDFGKKAQSTNMPFQVKYLKMIYFCFVTLAYILVVLRCVRLDSASEFVAIRN